MAAATRFHAKLTGRKLRQILPHFFAAQLLADHNLTARINPMHLKDLLCHIQPYCCNLHRGRSSLCSRFNYFDSGTTMPYRTGASIPLSRECSVENIAKPIAIETSQSRPLSSARGNGRNKNLWISSRKRINHLGLSYRSQK